MKLACIQLEISGGTVSRNVNRALDRIAEAAANDADLVVLPELFDVGYFAFDAYDQAATSVAGERIERFAAAAADHEVALLAGTIVEDLAASAADDISVPESSGLANTAVLFDNTGERKLIYRKHHLFGYGSEETARMVPGAHVSTTTIAGVRVGVTTCYDLRFPSLYRRLVDDGVECILVPSAWPYPRIEHWRTLGRARAIENLAYVATVNGSGRFGDDALCGRTTIYDPWGTTLASSDEEPEIVTAHVDADRVTAVRAEFPALADRR